MRTAICTLQSVTPYSPGKWIGDKKQRDETHEQFEDRTWWLRGHYDENGKLYIPPMAFKNCLAEAAKFKSIQIPGKGKSTYTKHFEAGVLVMQPLVLPVSKDDVQANGQYKNTLHLPSDGQRGGSKRVVKHFPIIREWSGDVEFFVLDEIIDNATFETHLVDAGQFIGIGTFRPRHNGYFGRFTVEKVKWSNAK